MPLSSEGEIVTSVIKVSPQQSIEIAPGYVAWPSLLLSVAGLVGGTAGANVTAQAKMYGWCALCCAVAAVAAAVALYCATHAVLRIVDNYRKEG